MLDNVEVFHAVSPTPSQLKQWVSHPLILPDGDVKPKYFQNFSAGGVVPINCTYYPPNTKYPKPHLRIGLSLPLALFGNNVQLITEQFQIQEAIDQVNKYLGQIPWLPSFDFGNGTLFRVDATHNHYCGDRVPDYIRALAHFEDGYPQRDTRPWKNCGVQFACNSTTTTFYDLQKRHGTSLANGYLRQETSMRHTWNIERKMGKRSPILNDLTVDWLANILEKDLEMLKLDNAMICNRDLAEEKLKCMYKPSKVRRLLGHLISLQSMKREQLLGEVSANTLRSWNKDLHNAGVALTMTDKVSLSPLSIQRKAQKYVGGLK